MRWLRVTGSRNYPAPDRPTGDTLISSPGRRTESRGRQKTRVSAGAHRLGQALDAYPQMAQICADGGCRICANLRHLRIVFASLQKLLVSKLHYFRYSAATQPAPSAVSTCTQVPVSSRSVTVTVAPGDSLATIAAEVAGAARRLRRVSLTTTALPPVGLPSARRPN